MPLLQSCCCFKTLKNGSFVSAIYTLIFYTMVLTAGSFHIHTVIDDQILFSFTCTMVSLAALCVVTSILLIIGLYSDNKRLLLPWLITLSLITSLDIGISVYLLSVTTYNPFIMTLFVIDFVICSVNIYCIMAVISQYQIIKRAKRNSRRSSQRDKSISCGGEFDDDFDDQRRLAEVRRAPFRSPHRSRTEPLSPETEKRQKEEAELEAMVHSVEKRIRERGQPKRTPMMRSLSATGPPISAHAHSIGPHSIESANSIQTVATVNGDLNQHHVATLEQFNDGVSTSVDCV